MSRRIIPRERGEQRRISGFWTWVRGRAGCRGFRQLNQQSSCDHTHMHDDEGFEALLLLQMFNLIQRPYLSFRCIVEMEASRAEGDSKVGIETAKRRLG